MDNQKQYDFARPIVEILEKVVAQMADQQLDMHPRDALAVERHSAALDVLDPAVITKARGANVYVELDEDCDGDEIFKFCYRGRSVFCYDQDELENKLDDILDPKPDQH